MTKGLSAIKLTDCVRSGDQVPCTIPAAGRSRC